MPKRTGDKIIFFFLMAVGTLGLLGFGALSLTGRVATPHRDTVTLHAAPGNASVQMFDELRDGLDVGVSTLPDGTRCTKVGDLLRYGNGETALFFYKLNCGGHTGYVNADWVR